MILNVTAGKTSTFAGNTANDPGVLLPPRNSPANSIHFTAGRTLDVNVAAAGLLDMRDPMSERGTGTIPTKVTENGGGVWALSGTSLFGVNAGDAATEFHMNSGTLYLYAADEAPNPTTSTSTALVTSGTIALNGGSEAKGFSSFTLGTGATLVAAGENEISVNGSITLEDGATIRGGTAADAGFLPHDASLPSGGIASSLTLTPAAGNVVGLQGQLKVEAVAFGDTFTLHANLADASVSAHGNLLIPGEGTVILDGANDYSGPTQVAAGKLQAGAIGAFSMKSAFTVESGATLDLNNLNQSIGSLAGAGSVTLGSATLTTGNDETNTTFSGVLSGSGALEKVGSGSFIITGDNLHGDTIIKAGTLVVGVPSPSQDISFALGEKNVSVESGATLRTTSFFPAGTVPGVSTGKALEINVKGNYVQKSGAVLSLGLGGRPIIEDDHLQVGGNINIENGAILEIHSLAGSGFRPSNGDSFKLLTGSGTRAGTFGNVIDNFNNRSNLQRIDLYAANGYAALYLAEPSGSEGGPGDIGVNGTPDDPKGGGAGESGTGEGGTGPTVEGNLILNVSNRDLPLGAGPVPDAFLLAALEPTAEQLGSMFQISFANSVNQRLNLNDRMLQIRQGSTGFVSPMTPAPQLHLEDASPPDPNGKEVGKKEVAPPAFAPSPTNRWGVWVNGWGNWASVDDDHGVKGYDFTTGGGSFGIDYRISDRLAVGAWSSYGHSWTDLKPGNIDVDTGLGGIYATYWNQGFWVNGAVYAGYNSYDTSRSTLLRGLSATGSPSGYEISTWVTTGYDFKPIDNLSIGPVFSAQYVNAHVNGFTEQGAFLPLNIHSDSEESWITDLGFQASYTWHVGNIAVIPSLYAVWEHEYKVSRIPITFSSAAFPGVSATTFGPEIGQDRCVIDAGANVQWTPRISTYIGYHGQVGAKNYEANGVSGTFSFSF